ncbi:MAG: MotA/TolQ/ExbB proton channel family protein [Thermoanaerobacteraceae bacterium]|nr:MotA/TolQ/ExbB proton channel family protein [Thermoanaerobacteraceae bacterium]
MRLDMMTIIGIVAGLAVIIIAIVLGGNIGLFINIQGILITLFGSFAALLINFNFNQISKVFATVKQVFIAEPSQPLDIVERFSELAKRARREGLLALEDEIDEEADPFFAKSIQLMVDGLEPELIREIMENNMENMRKRHELGQRVINTWAELAPAFGMIGTLIGLIQMLSKLDDPSALGPSMSVALLTTFYGALLANLILIPIAGKLALKNEEEMLEKRIILEGVLGIQSGMNPRILEEKLKVFIPPSEREKEQSLEGEELEDVTR